MLRKFKFDTSVVIEPNVRFVPELQALHRRFGVKHVRAAAWVNATELTFYVNRNDEASSLLEKSPTGNWSQGFDCKPEGSFEDAARDAERNGSILRRALGNAICDRQRTERVRAVDLAKVLFRHTKRGDRVFMKMDIEGAEDVVLPHLISTGALARLTMCQIEFHQNVNASTRQFVLGAMRAHHVYVWPEHYMLHLTRFLMHGPVPPALLNQQGAAYLAAMGNLLDDEAVAAREVARANEMFTRGGQGRSGRKGRGGRKGHGRGQRRDSFDTP